MDVSALPRKLDEEPRLSGSYPHPSGTATSSGGLSRERCNRLWLIYLRRGGAILDVLSALSWFSFDGANSCAAAKAAEWSLTNGIRLELAGQGTHVTGMHLGAADTDLMAGYQGPMLDPAAVATAAAEGIEAGEWEILVDDRSTMIKSGPVADPKDFYTSTSST